MLIEEALKTYLGTVAPVTALISTRIYPETLPQEPTLPAVKYDIISIQRHHNIDFAWASIQFTLVAKTHLASRQLADVFRKALQREKRVMSGIEVTQISVEDEQGPIHDEQLGEYFILQTYQINYREV